MNENSAAQAVQEAKRIAAADEYFQARTWIMDTNDNRRIFEAGFDRAYALLSKLRAPVADEPPGGTRWPVLRAMARNYTAGKHTWDALDAEACEQAAEEIRHLRAALESAPVAPAEVMDALNWVDDFIARCNRDDRGSCESVNVLRRALASAPVAVPLGWKLVPIEPTPEMEDAGCDVPCPQDDAPAPATVYAAMIGAAPPAPEASAPVAGKAAALELRGVPETIKEGGGFWRSCTGCHELNEGRDTGPYSAVLGCHLGQGCSECGGIGAIWDSTDYQTMADDMARDMGQSVSAAPLASVPVATEDGYRLVPTEPTHAMLQALSGEWHSSKHEQARANYSAMLKAAPMASVPAAGEAVYTLRVRGAIQAWTPTAAAFSIPDGEHQLFLSPAAPQPSSEPARILFPSHLRKMWSGGEVQAWLDQHQGVTPPPATAKGSLARYRQWKAEQDQAAAPCTCPSGDGSLRHPCPAHPEGGSHGPASVCR